MRKIVRLSVAQVFDLALFFLLLVATAIFFLPQLYGAKLLLAAPILWMPIEAFLLATVGTTLGKKLFGVRVQERSGKKLTLARAAKHAAYLWNLEEQVRLREEGWGMHTLQAVCLAALSAALFVGHYFRDIWLSEEVEFFKEEVAGDFDWYFHKEPSYSLIFPKKPIRIQSELPVPKSKERLHLEEYKCKSNDLEYSLSYLTFPKRWLRWGSSLILKGSLKMIAGSIPGAKIRRTSKMKYQALPSLEYEFALLGGKEAAGRLILQENRLYRIEVTYPRQERESVREALAH